MQIRKYLVGIKNLSALFCEYTDYIFVMAFNTSSLLRLLTISAKIKNKFFLLILFSACVSASEPPWVVKGSVESVVHGGGDTLFYAGDFSKAGPLTGPLGVVSNGSILHAFPDIVGEVRDIQHDGQAWYYIGGEFSLTQNSNSHNLIRVNARGEIDQTWQPNPDGVVNTININDAGVFVGGDFKHIAGEERGAVAKFAMDGKLLPWLIDLSYVNKIVSDETRVYIGGSFQRTKKLNSTGGLIGVDKRSGRQVWLSGLQDGTHIIDIAIKNGKLYLCGRITFMGRDANFTFQNRNFAVINITPKEIVDINLKLSDDGSITSVETHGENIYLSGKFSSVNGISRQNIVELTSKGEVTSWIPPSLGETREPVTLKVIDNLLYVMGGFKTYSSHLGGLSRYSVSGDKILPTPYVDGTVNSITPLGRKGILVAGDFHRVGKEETNYLFQLDPQGKVQKFNAAVDGPVNEVWHVKGLTWLSGAFNGISRYWCPGFIATDQQGSLAMCPQVKGKVSIVTEFGDYTVVAGNFKEFNGQKAKGIVLLDHETKIASITPIIGPEGEGFSVNDVATHKGKLYIAASVFEGGYWSHSIYSLNTDGKVERIKLPIAATQIESHGDIISLISWDKLIEYNTETGETTHHTFKNHSIYISPSISAAYANGSYFIGSERKIGGMGTYGTTLPVNVNKTLESLSFNNEVHQLLVDGDTLWVAGKPTTSSAKPSNSVISIDLTTRAVNTIPGISPTAKITAIANVGDQIVVGGNATSLTAQSAGPILKTDLRGVVDSNWKLRDPYQRILSMDVLGSNLYLCGQFDSIHVIASIDIETGNTKWKKPVQIGYSQCTLKVHNGNIYLAEIKKIESYKTSFAILDSQGNVIEHDIVNGKVSSFNLSNGKAFITGDFTEVFGQVRPGIACIDRYGKLTSWSPNLKPSKRLSMDRFTLKQVVNVGDIYLIMGEFHAKLNGNPIWHVVAVNKDGKAIDWRLSHFLSSSITTATKADEMVVVAGYFNTISKGAYDSNKLPELNYHGIIALDRTGAVYDWNPGVLNKRVNNFLVFNNRIYAAWQGMGSYSEKYYKATYISVNIATLGPLKPLTKTAQAIQ